MDCKKLHAIIVEVINEVGLDVFKSTSIFASNERKQRAEKDAA